MIRTHSAVASFVMVLASITGPVRISHTQSVEGPNLKSRFESALKRGRSDANSSQFWLTYSFTARNDVAVNADRESPFSNTLSFENTSVSIGKADQSSQVRVLLLYDGNKSAISRIELENEARQREPQDYPVYRMERAPADESLSLLTSLLNSNPSGEAGQIAVTAIAIHNDSRAASILESIALRPGIESVRTTAVTWLGLFPEKRSVLEGLIRNESEKAPIRNSAVLALTIRGDAAAAAALIGLYESVSDRSVKRQIVLELSNLHATEVTNFLVKAATGLQDVEVSREAVFALTRSPAVSPAQLMSVFDSTQDKEIRKEIIFAVSRFEASKNAEQFEGMLSRLYDSERSEEVKREIIFSLGKSGNESDLKKLIDVAENDPSEDLRREARMLLKSTSSPATKKFRQEPH